MASSAAATKQHGTQLEPHTWLTVQEETGHLHLTDCHQRSAYKDVDNQQDVKPACGDKKPLDRHEPASRKHARQPEDAAAAEQLQTLLVCCNDWHVQGKM